ncbi:MAG: hypothetical protein EOP50_11450 [Sphingobacteriales bacterium]|nr:MAG: hypothetical protein EOP50_11450 [Sphingobacteriales bacterium]
MIKVSSLLLLFASSAGAAGGNPLDLDKIFADADFRPSIPSQLAIESAYGAGKVVMADGEKYSFYDIGNGRQLRIAYNEGINKRATYATDITVCDCRFIEHAPTARRPVTASSMLSMSIGNSLGTLKMTPSGYQKKRMRFGRMKIDILEANPIKGESDLYIRYLTRGDRIIGFSIGVTE